MIVAPKIIISVVFSLVIFVFAAIIGVSQLFTMFKTRNTSGTSLVSYVLFLACALFSLVWGFLFYFSRIDDWISQSDKTPITLLQFAVMPAMATYAIELVGIGFQFGIKVWSVNQAKKQHVTELELSKTLLSKCKTKADQYKMFWILIAIIFGVVIVSMLMLVLFTNPKFNANIPSLDPSDSATQGSIITFSVLGAALWEAMSWPQFVKCIKTRDTSGISFNWALFLPISCVVCLTYSVLLATTGDNPFTFDTIGAVIFNGIICNTGVLVIKLINRIQAKKHHLSELEYTRKYINKKQKRA